MVLGLGMGLTVGPVYQDMTLTALGSLAVLLTVALAEVDLGSFGPAFRWAPLAPILNLALLSALLLAYGSLAARELWPGFVIMAAVPSAISVIPFTAILRGDLRLSVAGTFLYYVVALGSTPAVALALLGRAVDPGALVTTLVVLILLPLVASRGVRRTPLRGDALHLARNLTFFVLNLTIGAANRAIVLTSPGLALEAFGAAAAAALTSAAVLFLVLRRLSLPEPRKTSLLLFGTFKNNGFAATVALTLFGASPALLPPTMTGIFEVLWISTLSRTLPWARAAEPPLATGSTQEPRPGLR